MYLVLLFALILFYLYGNIVLSLLASLLLTIYILQKNRGNMLNGLLQLLIATIPISYYGMDCSSSSHLVKFYNFVLLAVLLYLLYLMIKLKIRLRLKTTALVFLFLLYTFLRVALTGKGIQAIVDYCQIVIVIIPIWLFYEVMISRKIKFHINTAHNIITLLQQTVVATSLGVIFQYLAYELNGRRLGAITFFTGRHIFDLLFTGYSVLSVFLGIGFVLIFKKMLDNKGLKPFDFLNLIIISIAMVLNTSRAGLLAALCISAVLLVIKLLTSKKKLKSVTILFVMIATSIFVLSGLALTRDGYSTFNMLTAGNGRDNLAKFGIDLLFSNAETFFWGIGFSGGATMGSQHNMFLEIATQFGIIGLVSFLFILIVLLIYINKSQYKYIVWQILLSFQFVSSFFATTFIVPVVFVVLIDAIFLHKSQNELLNNYSN